MYMLCILLKSIEKNPYRNNEKKSKMLKNLEKNVIFL